jgi:alkylglycerol monooxygenase
MEAALIAAAIPVFFLAIGIELLVMRLRGRRLYVYHDSIANLSNGVGQLVFGVLLRVVTVGLYAWVYEHGRVATLPTDSVVVWVLVFVGVDLGYYAFHRASHRVNFLWAIHAVHHQSEEYNLSVALRQAWLEPAVSVFFYLPLALAGFHPALLATAATINTLYQFWVHTRLVDKLGPLEGYVNSPAAHRVHHGRNPKYIDKNYAGMLTLWDRVFGTYQREEEEPVYGVVKPLHSLSPLWANLEAWQRIGVLMARADTLGEKLSAFVRPPEWLPKSLGARAEIPEVTRQGELGWDIHAPRAANVYVGLQFFVVALLATGFLLKQNELGPVTIPLAVAWFIAAMTAWGGLVEGRSFALPLELLRLAVAPLLGARVGAELGLPWGLEVGAAVAAVGLLGLVFVAPSRSAPRSEVRPS